jgi:hypothetical protein
MALLVGDYYSSQLGGFSAGCLSYSGNIMWMVWLALGRPSRMLFSKLFR